MNKIKFNVMTIKIDENNKMMYKLESAIVTRHDEYTYYYSPRFLKDYYKSLTLQRYRLFDRQTGVVVCSGDSKKELIEEYNKLKSKYLEYMNKPHYEYLIKIYQGLIKYRSYGVVNNGERNNN